MAFEQHRARVKQARREWQKQRMPFMRRQPERLVFIDESWVRTNLTRLRARACRGQRLRLDAPFCGWGTQTFIAGLTSEGLIAPWVIEGAMDGSASATYVRDVLAPELTPGTVFILDKLATHRNVEAAAAIPAAKCQFRSLPPHSPDLNPIEQAFSKLMAHLRKMGARTFDDLFQALCDIGTMVSPQECRNDFNAAGYVAG